MSPLSAPLSAPGAACPAAHCRHLWGCARVLGSVPARVLLAALLVALIAGAALPAAAQGQAPDKFAGTYRIEGWRALEARGMHQFFYLHPDGRFLLAASWPGNERSRFVGTWSVTEDRMYLNGSGSVETNQGDWQTGFQRTYRIRVAESGFVLQPEPRKNRYGLLGWPNAFRYHRRQPAPNLPDVELPEDAEAMGRHIAGLLKARE